MALIVTPLFERPMSSRGVSDLWFTFPCHGATWKVYLSDENVFRRHGYPGAQGLTLMKDAEIHILADLEMSLRLSVLCHEFVHVVCSDSNKEFLKNLFGCKVADVWDAEERLAAFLSSGFAQILRGANLVRLPRGPKRRKRVQIDDDE